MIRRQKFIIILYFYTSLIFPQIFTGCTREPQYIIFKTGERDQLQERALKYCYGDFKVLEEEEIGPYTRAHLECKE